MASLKALKIRIGSVKSTQKITKAMKMVAAAKLRRAQQGAEAGRPYATRMAEVVASIASGVTIGPQSPKLLAGTGKDETHGIERDNARQRHWLARFRRRSIVVSKAKRMVDVSIALIARFAGNDRIGDLISMLT